MRWCCRCAPWPGPPRGTKVRTRAGLPGPCKGATMGEPFAFPLLTDPAELAKLGEWSEALYRDFVALRRGELSEAELRAKYVTRAAILCLDMTGFTETAMRLGELQSLLRIRDVQTVCLPVFSEHGARIVRAFADDLTAVFDGADAALEAALEAHRRVRAFNASPSAGPHPADCCIGLGYGDVFAIGPNRAMGDEMNRASKLGEDTARAYETLITENAYEALRHRSDCAFTPQHSADLPFPYYSVTPRPPP
jgi:adenylate cyclase